MLVVQTAAEPPNQGRMLLQTINCIWKSKNALRNKVDAKSNLVVLDTSWPALSRADLWNVEVLELTLPPWQPDRLMSKLDVTIGKSSRDQDDGHNVAWRSGRVGHRDCAL